MRKVWVIQRPKFDTDFDMDALKRLGEVNYLLQAAPNAHNQERITADLKHMVEVLKSASDDDVFITLGGSPISQALWGAAFVIANKTKINYGLFSRGMDGDGRRGGKGGSYQIVPIDFSYDEGNE